METQDIVQACPPFMMEVGAQRQVTTLPATPYWNWPAWAEAVKRFVIARDAQGEDAAPTHVSMSKGKFHVPWLEEAAFLKAYAAAVLADAPVFMVEQRTPVYRLFVDADMKYLEEEGGNAVLLDAESRVNLAKEVQSVVKHFFPFASDVELRVIVCTTEKCLHEEKGDVAYDKYGVHLVWPGLIVDDERALDIRESIVKYFKEHLAEYVPTACHGFEDLFDESVYGRSGPGSALRMVGSRKAATCAGCKDRPQLRKECKPCNRSGKMDAARPYKALCVLAGSGERDLAQEEVYKQSMLRLVQDTKIRSRGPLTEGYRLPDGAPRAADRAAAEASAKRQAKKRAASTVRKDEKKSADDEGSVAVGLDAILDAVRTFSVEYAEATIRDTKHDNDGSTLVLINGPQYCHSVKREHASNRIFFVVRGGQLTQYCYDEGCKDKRRVSKPLFKRELSLANSYFDEVDDALAARVFAEATGDLIRRNGDDVYLFDEKTGLWDKSMTAFRQGAARCGARLRCSSPDGKKVKNYAGNEVCVTAMRKWVPSLLPKSNFPEEHLDSSLGQLLFDDGIFNLRTGVFTRGFDPSIVFMYNIPRSFASAERNEAKMMEVRTLFFTDPYPDHPEAGEYLLKALTMAIVGDYVRKKYYVGWGKPNCGKGVLVAGMRAAFGDFVGEFDLNNLIFNKHNSQDEAKRLAWLLDWQGKRLMFSSEVRMDKDTTLDGNTIKSIVSGGDVKHVRRNYQDQVPLVIRSSMMFLLNDMPKTTPEDPKCVRKNVIAFERTYVTNPDPRKRNESLASADVKTTVKTDVEFMNAFVWLLADTFKSMSEAERRIGGHIVPPECVVQETKQWKEEVDVETLLEERYIITGDSNDHEVPSKEIHDYLRTKGVVMSKVTLGKAITAAIGLADDKKAPDVSLHGVKYRRGLKYQQDAYGIKLTM